MASPISNGKSFEESLEKKDHIPITKCENVEIEKYKLFTYSKI